jgi:hypothetical protein
MGDQRWQRKMYDSIQILSHRGLMDALDLSNGEKHWDNNLRCHTLNLCVKSLLTQPVEKFDLKLIETLLDNGAHSLVTMNVYEKIIQYSDQYVQMNPKKTKEAFDNVITLLRTMVDRKFSSDSQAMVCALRTKNVEYFRIVMSVLDPMNVDELLNVIQFEDIEMIEIAIKIFEQKKISMTSSLILHGAIKTRNMDIIHLIIRLCEPETDCRTMILATETKDPQIMSLMFGYGARVDDSVLKCALSTYSVIIIKEFIVRGHGPRIRMLGPEYWTKFWDHTMRKDLIKEGTNFIELLMCIDVKINPVNLDLEESLTQTEEKESLTQTEEKISNCHALQNKTHDPMDPRIRGLKINLKETMDQLMEWPHNKQNSISLIDDSLDHLIPGPLIGMIYEYWNDSLVSFIDWSKY